AEQLNAAYFRITRGDFTVQHARVGTPTIYSVINLAALHERVLVHIDELDKFSGMHESGEWSASMSSDLFNLADVHLPIDEFLATDFPGSTGMSAKRMR